MIKADIDLLKSYTYCVQLAVLLITHYSSHQRLYFIAIKETPLTLPPLDLGSKWFLPVAFFCNDQTNSSHVTTTKSGSGIDLEVVFFIGL